MNLVILHKHGLYRAIAIVLICISCDNPREGQSVQDGSANLEKEMMTSMPATRLLNYWDDFNFKTKVQEGNPDEVEQKLVDFIALFPTVSDTVVQVTVHDMLKKASVEPE